MKKFQVVQIKSKNKNKKRSNYSKGYKIIGTKNKNKEFKNIFWIGIFLIITIFITILYFYNFKNKVKKGKEDLIYDPIPPSNNNEYSFKSYEKSTLNLSNIRYSFKDLYNKRKLFKINYSYIPYTKINKSLSYDENAEYIYNLTGMLNITKLDYYYYNNIDKNTLTFNHIHLSMGFDNNYVELSCISIASILNTSNSDTYIHFHITAVNFTFEDMKKIIQLKKINKNVDFVFYNSKQAEYDFGERAKQEWRGLGEYTRVLAPQIVNNTNRLLILDSGDIIAQKDISEVFYYDLQDNYFSWILEDAAGNIGMRWDQFFRNKFYPNTGVCLVNVKLFRQDNLYEAAFYVSIAYKDLPCPMQDIFIVISNYKFCYLPLKYNAKLFFENDEQMKNRQINNKIAKRWIDNQSNSQFKYSIDEILEAALDPVINHIYQEKITNGIGSSQLTIQWINYAKLTGFYEKIKKLYPKPFKYEKNLR